MITFSVEIEQEEDGRWIAEVTELPGVLAYGGSDQSIPATYAMPVFRAFPLRTITIPSTSTAASASPLRLAPSNTDRGR